MYGTDNTVNDENQIIYGVNNSISSGSTLTNVVGINNSNVINSNGNIFGINNTIDSNLSQCFGTNNTCVGRNASAFGSDIANDTRNSICLGDRQIATIFPNSLICDLGRDVVPFKNIYVSGSISNMSSGSNYITQEDANGIYQPLSGMGAYQLVSNMGLYQLVSGMGAYLSKTGGTMTGTINLNNNQLTNVSKMTTSNGTFNVGYNNADSYISTTINIACGNNNSITNNDQIIFGANNSILSNQTLVVGRNNININTGLGNVIGRSNTVSAPAYVQCFGTSNTIGSSGYYNVCIGSSNNCNAQYASCIGSDITNNTPNSLCLGNSAISTIFPNSLVCDLGTSTKPFKDIYYSGELIKESSKLDLNYINSFL